MQLFSKNIYVAAFVSESVRLIILEISRKLSKILDTMKHSLQEYFPGRTSFKKGSFSLFCFLFMKVLGSETLESSPTLMEIS